mmetsp:Transcript_55827/g.180969  ORF Transcript_55827/g.180969 Transcript_55827/m.180969 type:complete len:106 (+) Transcript_55827:262-579(+)
MTSSPRGAAESGSTAQIGKRMSKKISHVEVVGCAEVGDCPGSGLLHQEHSGWRLKSGRSSLLLYFILYPSFQRPLVHVCIPLDLVGGAWIAVLMIAPQYCEECLA